MYSEFKSAGKDGWNAQGPEGIGAFALMGKIDGYSLV